MRNHAEKNQFEANLTVYLSEDCNVYHVSENESIDSEDLKLDGAMSEVFDRYRGAWERLSRE